MQQTATSSLAPPRRNGKLYLNPVPTTVGGPALMPKALWRQLTERAERTPRRPIGPFTTDPSVYATMPASGLRVTWFGHSSSLVEIDGARILIDPVWDERAAPVTWAGPKRFFPPTLDLSALPPIDVVVLSHDHYDHLGARTVAALAAGSAAAKACWVCPLGVGAILVRMGVPADRIIQLNWTETTRIGHLAITALPARHFSGRSLGNRNQTLWASFAVRGPRHCIFYGADSGEWDGFADVAREYGPFDLTMLEIGAYDPLWSDIHMGPDGALRTFAAMGSHGLLMPIHWGLFRLALHAWDQPIARIFAAGEVKLWSPEPGLPSEVVRGEELRSRWWKHSTEKGS